MADFPTALDAALRDHYSPAADFASPLESPRGYQARMRALERKHGSQAAAARAAGIDPNTWNRWKRGVQKPGRVNLARLGGAHKALLRAAKVARKGHPSQISVQAIVACLSVMPGRKRKSLRYNGNDPNRAGAFRWFRADRLSTAQLRNVAGAWAAGGTPDHVAGVLLDAIADAYGATFAFEGTNVTVEVS